LKKKKCSCKKLSFSSQLLKNTKIHVNLLILGLKVSSKRGCELLNQKNKIWEDVFDEIAREIFRQCLEREVKINRETGFSENPKMFFHKICIL
jgi:hypothetical protein